MSKPGKGKEATTIRKQRRSDGLTFPNKRSHFHNGECPTCGTELMNFRPSISGLYSYCPKCGWTNKPHWKVNP